MLLFFTVNLLILLVLPPWMNSALDHLDMTPSAIGLVNDESAKLDSVEQTRIGSWRAEKDLW